MTIILEPTRVKSKMEVVNMSLCKSSRAFLLLTTIIILEQAICFTLFRRHPFRFGLEANTFKIKEGRPSSFITRLYQEDTFGSDGGDEPLVFLDPYQFLGRGDDAIVRPGVVLVPPLHEYSHFLMKTAIFVFAMGYDAEVRILIKVLVCIFYD